MRADELMQYVNALDINTILADAEKAFIAQNAEILPVVNNGRFAGMLKKCDIARALPSDAVTLNKWEMSCLLGKMTIEGFTRRTLSVLPDSEMSDIVRLAVENGVYNFPVVEADDFKGMLTDRIMFRHLAYEANKPALKVEVNIRKERYKGPFFLKWMRAKGVVCK